MECKYCKKSSQDGDFIYETKYFRVFLADEQSYLGRCVIALKRHCETLSDLNEEEWLDFAKLVKHLESALKKAFDATMFNWTCLMNDAYKSSKPNPHAHGHFRPRYNHKVKFAGLVFEDTEFGYHYDRTRTLEVSDEVKKKIIQKIKDNL